MAEMGLEDFLGYETNNRGGGKFLSKWKKRNPPEVRVWLHTRTPFVTLWQHGIPEMRTFEDRDTKETVRKVWGGNFNCLEHDTVLQQQNKRTNGQRDIPPQVCPLCKLMEYVRQQIAAGKLNRATPIFRFEVPALPGEDETERGDDQLRILYAGGFSDMLKGTLSQEQQKDLRKAGISLRDAWQENVRAKCNFVFRVVDNDNLEDGVQIAIETSLVGEKVQQVIRDQMKRLGKTDGNPLLNPYAFQWEHHPKQQEFQKKYHVLDLSTKQYPMTPEIRALIVDEDPPDISRLTRPGNVRSLRAQLEQYALMQFPWDELFAAAEAQQANMAAEGGEDTSFEFGENAVDEADKAFEGVGATTKTQAQVPAETEPAATAPAAPAATVAPATAAPVAQVPPAAAPVAVPAPAATTAPVTTRRRAAPPPPPVEMGDPCDECKAPMKKGQLKCDGCGTEYDEVPDAQPAAAAAAPTPAQTGTVTGADGVVAGSSADKLNW